ncbi:hypothetical protein PR003_g7652 [Phytophthora rubi]|uniref:Uncharacterized protein n=1 Tax=Phytophthora rubi TaxID=129364 RepID=A0A6A4FL76_9STRA|nr:hypothetical protein PR003_g7652 [Phytophthora rubi]
MSTDGRAVTAPTTPSGRYRLRTHELAPVHLPRARASSSSTADGSKVEDLTVIVPARPRVSITGVGATPRGRAVLESVAFDPFSKSESFKLLLQNPEASSKRREAPAAVSEFRQWLLQHFPHLVQTLRSLCVISVESTRLQEELLPDPVTSYNEPVNQCSSKQDRIDEVQEEEDEDNEERGSNKDEVNADSDECWRLMLRYASVRSAVPGETSHAARACTSC